MAPQKIKKCSLTPEQQEFLRANHATMPGKKIAEHFGIKIHKLTDNIRFLNLPIKHHCTHVLKPRTEVTPTGFFDVEKYAAEVATI